ncbi:MAG: chalcone isomerase family protein [Myxococcales bacterium]|nr:chalcone isomerase family protein [Myxococcales bacterium]
MELGRRGRPVGGGAEARPRPRNGGGGSRRGGAPAALKKRDELRLTYLPGTRTLLQEGSLTRAVIPGKDFADALFSIWLGPRTETPHLRSALVGG